MQHKRGMGKSGQPLPPIDITLSTDPRSNQHGRLDQGNFLKEIDQKIKAHSNKEVHRYTTWVSSGLLTGVEIKQSNAENFRGQFDLATKRAEHIHVNLDSIPETESYITQFSSQGKFAAISGASSGRVTADELYLLGNDQGAFRKASFYVSGKKLSRRFALQDPINQANRMNAKDAARKWETTAETASFLDHVEVLLGEALKRVGNAFLKGEPDLVRSAAMAVRDVADGGQTPHRARLLLPTG